MDLYMQQFKRNTILIFISMYNICGQITQHFFPTVDMSVRLINSKENLASLGLGSQKVDNTMTENLTLFD